MTMPDRIDPNVLMDRAMAESGARLRAAMGITASEPPEPDPATHIATGPFFAHIVLRTLWPPPDPYPVENRETLAVVPASKVPGLAERLGLGAEELYKDADAEGVPSIVLGRAAIVAASNSVGYLYRPATSYPIAEAAEWTRRFSKERARVDLNDLRREAAAQEREEIRQREAARQARAKAEEERIKESLTKNDPRFKVAELERRVAEVEKREKEAAARKLAELEERLSKLPPA
jgi:hypothetical protein